MVSLIPLKHQAHRNLPRMLDLRVAFRDALAWCFCHSCQIPDLLSKECPSWFLAVIIPSGFVVRGLGRRLSLGGELLLEIRVGLRGRFRCPARLEAHIRGQCVDVLRAQL